MSAQEKSEVLTRVEETRWGKRRLLAQLQVPKSTYYRWRARALQGKQDSSGNSVRIPWNKLSPPEEAAVLATARESPEWSSRQLATWITDHLRLSVGGSTVASCRLLHSGDSLAAANTAASSGGLSLFQGIRTLLPELSCFPCSALASHR